MGGRRIFRLDIAGIIEVILLGNANPLIGIVVFAGGDAPQLIASHDDPALRLVGRFAARFLDLLAQGSVFLETHGQSDPSRRPIGMEHRYLAAQLFDYCMEFEWTPVETHRWGRVQVAIDFQKLRDILKALL